MAEVHLRIKEICKEQGITLEQLAKRLGILRTSLAQSMSRNSFSTAKIGEIAEALDVPVWQLFVDKEDIRHIIEDTASTPSSCPSIICPKCGARLKLVEDSE